MPNIAQLKESIPLYEWMIATGHQLYRRGREYVMCCPFHTEKTPSCYVDAKRYHCFGCGEHGDIADFVMKDGASLKEAIDNLTSFTRPDRSVLMNIPALPDKANVSSVSIEAPGIYEALATVTFEMHKTGVHVTLDTVHTYRAPSGKPLFYVARWKVREGKVIRPFYEKEPGVFISSLPKFKHGKPLYNLHLLANAASDATVYIVEGEKAADALIQQGLLATTTGGATTARGADWRAVGRFQNFIIWPDMDRPGIGYAKDVNEHLPKEARVVDVTDLQKGEDAYDYYFAHRQPRGTTPAVISIEELCAILPDEL